MHRLGAAGAIIIAVGACSPFASSTPDTSDAGPLLVEGGVDAAVDAGPDPTVDSGTLCAPIADNEDVRGPLAVAEPAVYWANGTSNSIRVFQSGSTATVLTNTTGGTLTSVAVAGGTIAWAVDRGPSGTLHVDTFTTLGVGPTVSGGLVPTSLQIVGSTVFGVAADRTQAPSSDLFIYSGASTYDVLRPVTSPVGYGVATNDGWIYVVANGVLQGLSRTAPTSSNTGVVPALASNGTNAFFVNGAKQLVKTVGVAISLAANNVDAVALAADQEAAFYFAAPPSKLLRHDLTTTEITPLADVPAGSDRLVASPKFLYYVEGNNRIMRCRKVP